MKIKLSSLLILVFAFSIGCGGPGQELKKKISELEQSVESSPSKDNMIDLERSYVKFTKDFPDDKEWCGRFLYRAAGLNYRIQNFNKSATQLEKGVAEYSSSSATANSVFLLAQLYETNLRNPNKAKQYYQMLIDKYPSHPQITEAELFFKPIGEKLKYKITKQEKLLRESPGETGLNLKAASELRRLYNTFINQVSDDPKGLNQIRMSSAKLNAETNNIMGAKTNLEQIINDPTDGASKAEARLLLADILENDLNLPDEAKVMAEAFLSENPGHAQAEDAKYYLKPAREKTTLKIKKLEDDIYSKEQKGKLDRRKATRLINSYESFAKQFPKDPKAPDHLYKAGEVARSINDFSKAMDVWKIVYEKYNSYEKAPQALFLQGFIHENDFRDLDNAKKVYTEFLKKYPKHDLADDVQFSLTHLGKPADEIIKSFGEKGK